MKFYLITIKADSQAITAYDTRETAMYAFHTEIAYAYNAQIDTTCMIVDTTGRTIKVERYEKPVEPETENHDYDF